MKKIVLIITILCITSLLSGCDSNAINKALDIKNSGNLICEINDTSDDTFEEKDVFNMYYQNNIVKKLEYTQEFIPNSTFIYEESVIVRYYESIYSHKENTPGVTYESYIDKDRMIWNFKTIYIPENMTKEELSDDFSNDMIDENYKLQNITKLKKSFEDSGYSCTNYVS